MAPSGNKPQVSVQFHWVETRIRDVSSESTDDDGRGGLSFYTESIVTPLFKKVYFRSIYLHYCGQIVYDFLEDQIDNSPFLAQINLFSNNWPKSTSDLLASFCLKGRPGKRVSVFLYREKEDPIDSDYIQLLLDLWKTNGNLHFELYFTGRIVAFQSFFKHETEKSVVIFSNCARRMECFTCECDQFKKCLLKERYPQYHNF
uniref:F-box domain-containing protein n=1 Tax=Steinernema glaseri TaxID=37863 RepID=A0A1I7YFW9_9BILA